ncbi:MAG: hypothetical protein IKB34_03785 [Clostridia bacterium]|nr:hypothetical protein [Clostridia bacterium]
MYNEFEHEDDNWRPEKSKLRKIAEKTFSIGFVTLVFLVLGFLVLRLIFSKPPKDMRTMLWNGSAIAAYEEEGKDFKVTYYPSLDSFSKDSMYSISQITHIKSIGQFQATVRYNERALNYLKSDYGLEALPAGEIFVFKLRDNFGKVYTEYTYTSASKSGYGYRHVIFEGVDMDDVTTLTLEVYYIEDVSGAENAVAELLMYRYDYAPQIYFYDPPESENKDILPRPSYTDKEPAPQS